jgi:hypothetical protein
MIKDVVMARKRYISKKYKEAPMIECACGCGETFKSVDEEGRERKYISGHNGRKYDDPTQHKREWNHRNREARYEYKKKYGYKRRSQLLTECGGKCIICEMEYDGKNAPKFDFHHRNPEEKEFNIGLDKIVVFAWKKILEEAKKCDIVCSNCHRMIGKQEY